LHFSKKKKKKKKKKKEEEKLLISAHLVALALHICCAALGK